MTRTSPLVPSIEGFGVRQWCAPAPALDDPRIAGVGERALAEVGAHQHRIEVLPGQLRLGFRQFEPVGNEFACQHVEFTHDGGIRATRGESDQRAGAIGPDDVGAAPDPLFVVNSAQLIDIDQDVPLGGVGAIAVQRGAPPQPARVGGIAPEVVEVVAATRDVRNPGVGVEHLECLGAHLFELRIAEFGLGRFVARTYPIQRLFSGYFFEPQVRVRARCHGSHSGPGGNVSCITPIQRGT